MAKKVRVILGDIYDRPAEWVLLPLAKMFHISLDPSPVRLGLFATILAWGLFSLSVYFTMPISSGRDSIMWVFWLGVALVVTSLYVAGYFLRHQDREPTHIQLNKIEQRLDNIEQGITELNKKLDTVIKL